jgi:ArsR family transcriptional regulator
MHHSHHLIKCPACHPYVPIWALFARGSIEWVATTEYACDVNTSTDLEQLDVVAKAGILKAVSDPTRLEILDMLSSEIRCNCHFQEHLDVAPNLLSYHLRVLREAGLLVGTKRGRWVDYELAPHAQPLIQESLPQGLRP